MDSVQTEGGASATLKAWRDLTSAVRDLPSNKGKERGLNIWFHDLVELVGKAGFSFTKKKKEDGVVVALAGASLTRFLNGSRNDLKLNFVKEGMPAKEAGERCSIGGVNFLKIEVLVEMDTTGF